MGRRSTTKPGNRGGNRWLLEGSNAPSRLHLRGWVRAGGRNIRKLNLGRLEPPGTQAYRQRVPARRHAGRDREVESVQPRDRIEASRLNAFDGTIADPKDVFRQAVREGATGIIVCHNHPSGDPSPSPEDIAVTKRLLEAGDVLGIRVLDHVIFGDGIYTSLKERNLM